MQARTEMIISALIRGDEPNRPRKKEISKNKMHYKIVLTVRV